MRIRSLVVSAVALSLCLTSLGCVTEHPDHYAHGGPPVQDEHHDDHPSDAQAHQDEHHDPNEHHDQNEQHP